MPFDATPARPALRFTDRDEQLRAFLAKQDEALAGKLPERTYSSVPDHRLNEGGIIGNAAAAGAWRNEDR